MGLESKTWLPFKLTFSYMWNLVYLGYTRPLEKEDIDTMLEEEDTCSYSLLHLQALLSSSATTTTTTTTTTHSMEYRLVTALAQLTTYDMAAAGIGKLLGDLLGFLQPLCVTGILMFLQLRAAGLRDVEWGVGGARLEMGYWWCIVAVVSSLLQNLCLHRHHHHSIRAGMHVRSALTGLVFNKTLRLTPGARLSHGGGKVLNLGTVDPNVVGMFWWYFHYSWASPLQLALAMAMLFNTLGASSFVGLGVLLTLVPLQGYLGSYLTSLAKAVLVHTDGRIKQSTEALGGIRIIKLLGMEASFLARIGAVRDKEVGEKWVVAWVQGLNSAFVEGGPLIASVLALVTYGMTSSTPLSPSSAFTALALFQILRLPIMVLPMLTGQYSSARASLTRLATFLEVPELVDYRREITVGGAAACFEGAVLSWGGQSGGGFSLSLGNLSLPASAVSVIVGPVGSGKSSLLSSLLGDMHLEGGSVEVEGGARRGGPEKRGEGGAPPPPHLPPPTKSLLKHLPSHLAYSSQTPFIFNASVKDNILFGAPLDEPRYALTLSVCALDSDLASLPQGDATEIGERGVNLSGGQKARVALARALYSPASTLLLDDVLSAVDAATRAHLWEKALLGPLGRGGGRSVILVTHSLDVLPRADFIVVMHGGKVVQKGGYEELIKGGGVVVDSPHPPPSQVIIEVGGGGGGGEGGEKEGGLSTLPTFSSPPLFLSDILKERGGDEGSAANPPSSSLTTTTTITTTAPAAATSSPPASSSPSPPLPPPSSSPPATLSKGKAAEGGDSSVLIKEEGRYRGAFEGKVYSTYLMSMGTITFFSILITLVTVTVARIMVDWVLAAWSVDSLGLSIPLYAGVFSAVSVGAIVLTLANAMLWAHGGLVAAKGLHAGMVARVLRAPISFFDTTPLGRIVNRFTSDVGILDKDLPTAMASASTLVLRILGTLVIQAVVLPWTLLGTLPLAALYVGIFLVYRASARELKRIDLASKSLASAVLVESAQGQSTIAAWGAGPRFEALLFKSVDENNRAYWAGNSLNRWLGLHLDWLGSALLGVIVGVAVGTPSQSNPGLVGLAITYALAIAGLLNWAVRSATECETLLSSAQRVLEYTSLVVEAPPIVPSHRPPAGWPTVGEVVITNLTVRHREGLQPCLKGVSVRVPGGSKVGVVGRTGSGKTSLTLALFRIIEASEGSVEIDGLDISKMGLDDLRGALSIVPQDATLFTGTVGTCLDPLGVFSEKELVAALAGVHFSTVSPASKVEEGGLNFSQGERQLLCLARALLRKSRVVVLDESTASMDSVLDTQLQKTLKTSLSGATVFVVAHRLETVADADYILVMDAGKVAEFGPPKELAAKVGGIYAQLLLKE